MKRIYLLLLTILLGSTTSESFAAIDIYMRVKDANGTVILGESIAANYTNWTELRGYGSSISLPVNIAGTVGIGRSTFDTLQFQVPLSSISLPLSKILTNGSRLSEVDIYFVKAGGTNPSGCQCAFYKIHMEDVFITNISESADDENVNQQISIKPIKIAWAYYKQNTSGTLPGSPTNQHGWDYSANRVFNYSF